MKNLRHRTKLLFLSCSLFLSNTFALPTIELVGDPDIIVCQMQAAKQLGYHSFDISSFDKHSYHKLKAVDRSNLDIAGLPHQELSDVIGSALKTFYVSTNDQDSLSTVSLQLIASLSVNPNFTIGFSGISLRDVLYLSSFHDIHYQNYKLSLPKSYEIKRKVPCRALLYLFAHPPHKKHITFLDSTIYAFHDATNYFSKKNITFSIALPIGDSHYTNKSFALTKLARKHQCSEYHILIKFLNSKKINVIPVVTGTMNSFNNEIITLDHTSLALEDFDLLEQEIKTLATNTMKDREKIFLQSFLMPLVNHIPMSRL